METQALESLTTPYTPPKPRISAWQQQAELLAHLCQFSQNVLCVVAPPASGKTEFVHYFLGLSFPGLVQKAILSPVDTVDALMEAVATAFQMPWNTTENNLSGSRAAFKQGFDAGHAERDAAWVLLVDDADQLSAECLQALLQLSDTKVEPRRQLHLILFGKPALEQLICSEAFEPIVQGYCHTLELAHLQARETQQRALPKDDQLLKLDETKLQNHPQSTLFSSERTPIVDNHDYQRGGNMSANFRTLMNPKKVLFHPITLGALAGIALGMIYLSLNPLDDAEWQNPPTYAQQLAQMNLDDTDTLAVSKPRAKIKIAQDEKAQPIGGVQKTPLAEQLPVIAPEEDSANLTPTAIKNSAIPVKASTEKAQPKQQQAAKSQPIKPQPVKKQPDAKQSARIASVPNSTQLLTSEQKLLAANQQYYTLQLIGGRHEGGIQQFIQQHQLADKALTYRKQVQGDDWYVVVLGQYPTKQAAESAANALPSTIKQETKPWVRSMKSVQSEIKVN